MGKLRIIIFNVEHGFCAFIRTPNDYTLLIDCGATETFSPIKYILENELSGVTKYNGKWLTKFVLSHPHDDHLSDIDRLIKDFPPGIMLRQKYDWEKVKTGDKEEYKNLDTYSDWQETYNQPVPTPPEWGMILKHIYLTPEDAKKIDENKYINNSSIPVFIEYKGSKITFPGDLEEKGWLELLRHDGFKTLLKGTSFFVTSHHGHSSGYCKEIYDCMGKPHFNIVSAHAGDESVDPAYSKAENAIGVQYNNQTRYMFSTRKDGTIILEVDENGNCTYWLKNFPDNL
jgi:beta-lactamase superfamily II metal-dependent hydrolase